MLRAFLLHLIGVGVNELESIETTFDSAFHSMEFANQIITAPPFQSLATTLNTTLGVSTYMMMTYDEGKNDTGECLKEP